MNEATVVELGWHDARTAGAAVLLARAFDRDPITRRLFPDGERRRRYLELGMRLQLAWALPYGHVYGLAEQGQLCGVAVWLPPGASGGRLWPALQSLPAAARLLPAAAAAMVRCARPLPEAPRNLVRFAATRRRAVSRAAGSWHLSLLGADPEYRGRGVARRLLKHMLSRGAVSGTGVWLETCDQRNVPLYERFGFTTIAHLETAVAKQPWWLMRRPPARRR